MKILRVERIKQEEREKTSEKSTEKLENFWKKKFVFFFFLSPFRTSPASFEQVEEKITIRERKDTKLTVVVEDEKIYTIYVYIYIYILFFQDILRSIWID